MINYTIFQNQQIKQFSYIGYFLNLTSYLLEYVNEYPSKFFVLGIKDNLVKDSQGSYSHHLYLQITPPTLTTGLVKLYNGRIKL